MFHYLKAAFLARVDIPLLGPLPLNLMAVGACALLGALQPAVWLLGLGLETLYLFTLAFHPRFQNWVDAREAAKRSANGENGRGERGADLQRLVDELGVQERKTLYALKGKLTQILELYGKFRVDEFTLSHNRESLTALFQHAARLLAARENIERHWSADPARLQAEVQAIEEELENPGLSAELRSSKTRTLEILRIRQDNQRKKATILAEIDSEIERIGQQYDLALENAAIGSKPQTVSAEIVFDPGQLAGGLSPLPDFGVAGPAPARRRRSRLTE